MTNQEALDKVKGLVLNMLTKTYVDKIYNCFNTLQQLIDNYNNLVQTIKEVNESNLKSEGTQYLVDFIEVQNGK